MSQVFIGAIQSFGFPFAPKGWSLCDGSQLSIQQYQSLFSLITNTYGGDGVQYFNVPDARGRLLMSQGQTDDGLYSIGQTGGVADLTLTEANLPSHTHPLLASATLATLSVPSSTDELGVSNGSDPVSGDQVQVNIYHPAGGATVHLADLTPSGSGLPVSLMQPYLVNNYCIALQGIYPTHN